MSPPPPSLPPGPDPGLYGGVFNGPNLSLFLSLSVSKSGVSEKAFFVFSSLASHAIPALLDTALQVITPVTRGMARPIDPLSMVDRHKVSPQHTHTTWRGEGG